MDREKLYEYLVARGLGADTASKVADCMVTLPEKTVKIALLYLSGKSISQIAESLHCKYNTVYMHLRIFHDARQSISINDENKSRRYTKTPCRPNSDDEVYIEEAASCLGIKSIDTLY